MTSVVVTGLGLATGLGLGADETWQALLEGRSGVAPLAEFDASSLRTRFGVEIDKLSTREFVADRRSLRNMTRCDQLAVVGAALAMRDAGLSVEEDGRDRAGLYLASHKEISDPTKVLDAVLSARNADGSTDIGRMGTEGAAAFYPLFYVEGLQAAALFYVSKAHNLRGPNTFFSGSSDAGLSAIGRAYRSIRRGEADVAVAGGFDDTTSWWNASKLDAFEILSGSNELGSGACRPFDRDRDGSVLGEGSAFFVLERASAALARGARIYAEITGIGSGFDHDGLVHASADGEAMTGAVGRALDEGRVGPEEVDLVVAEGAATVANDVSEANAIRRSLGTEHGPAVTSVKPATGHLMAGAGALNAAVAALAIRDGAIPPVLNLTDVDKDCADLDLVCGAARTGQIRHAMALAQGMEGQNNALLLSALTADRGDQHSFEGRA